MQGIVKLPTFLCTMPFLRCWKSNKAENSTSKVNVGYTTQPSPKTSIQKLELEDLYNQEVGEEKQ